MPCTRGVHRWINDRASSMLLVVCMVTLALMPVHAARAALWVEITVEPKTPRAGEVATINVQTFSFVQTRCIDDPDANPTPAVAYTGETSPTVLHTFEVTARSPAGDEHVILLKRTSADGSIWEGETVFPVPGEWALVMTMPYWPSYTPVPDPCSGSSIVFTVHAPDHVTPLATPCGTSVASPAP